VSTPLVFLERRVLSYAILSSLLRIIISPLKSLYLRVSAALWPAAPPPIITNLHLSLPSVFAICMGYFFGKG